MCPEILAWPLLNLGELVAETADGLDVAGVLGVGLYLLTDVLNMDVGGAGLAEEVAATVEVAHDLLSAVHPPRMGGQKRQNLKLLGRQRHGLPPGEDLTPEEVQLQARKLQLPLLVGSALRVQAPPPEVRPHPAHQLARSEWFGNV